MFLFPMLKHTSATPSRTARGEYKHTLALPARNGGYLVAATRACWLTEDSTVFSAQVLCYWERLSNEAGQGSFET